MNVTQIFCPLEGIMNLACAPRTDRKLMLSKSRFLEWESAKIKQFF